MGGPCVMIDAPCPSRSDKDAFEIAQSWVTEGYTPAREKFDTVAQRQKLLDYEAVMLAQKVAYHKEQIERACN